MNESSIMKQIQVALARIGARLFRNNVGLFELKDGRRIRTGLAVGSSDLIGFHPVEITPAMVGRRVAVFAAVEVKSGTGRLRPDQASFIAAVRAAGGIAFVARSEDEALRMMEGALCLNP